MDNGKKGAAAPTKRNVRVPAGPEARVILVIEDHSLTREPLCLLLEMDGFHPIAAESAEEGLDRVERGVRPMAILMDINGCNGAHFRKRQMALPEIAGVPIILTTGVTRSPEVLAAEFQIPTDHVMRKPYDFNSISALLRRHCPE